MSVTTEVGLEVGGGRPSPLALLFAPDRAMDRQARVGRAGLLFVFAFLCSIFLGVALAVRVDATDATLRKLDQSGQLQGMSDRQVSDEVKSAERVSMVVSVAKGVVSAPVQLGTACLSILLLTWFFRGRLKGAAVAPVAAATLLPGALADVLDGAIALRHAVLPPDGAVLAPRTAGALLALAGRPLPPPLMKLGDAFDVFSLWAAVMLGFGLVAAGQVPKRTALLGTLVAWVCYRLLTHVAAGG